MYTLSVSFPRIRIPEILIFQTLLSRKSLKNQSSEKKINKSVKMVIAYEDYPWKNPLRIYWASVTGSRKVSLSQPTLLWTGSWPNLSVPVLVWSVDPWVSHDIEENIQALWKLLWLLNLFQVYFSCSKFFKFRNSKVQENYFRKSSKTWKIQKLRKIQNRRTWPSRNGSL